MLLLPIQAMTPPLTATSSRHPAAASPKSRSAAADAEGVGADLYLFPIPLRVCG